MNNKPSFKKTLIASAIGSALVGFSGGALAQGNDPQVLEEIVVTGILGSLQRSMDIKRESQGVVDAISAEDIGKFPDTNLAESLQRITGVSIDRANGEGSRVTVRGIGPNYNLVTLNGRQMPASSLEDTNASASRSFDFANLASESVSGVEVYKTSRASIPTGGLGATINILTNRPLDNPGLNASVGLKGVIDDSTSVGADITPEVSGIYSQTFADETFGVSLSASYQERENGSRVATSGAGWFTYPWWDDAIEGNFVNPPEANSIYSLPQQLIYAFNEVQRTRINGQLALQYRPMDSLTATVDYTYSKLEVAQQYSELSAWFNRGGAARDVQMTGGPVSTPLSYTEVVTGSVPSDVAMAGGSFARANENNSLGLNLDWQVTSQLSLELDAHSSTAESRPDSPYGSHNVLGAAAMVRQGATVDYSQDFPVLQIHYPDGVNSISPSDMQITGSSFRNSYMKSEIDQIQLKGHLEFDDGQSIDFGVSSIDAKNRSAYTFVNRDHAWGGVGGLSDTSVWIPATVRNHFNASGSNDPRLINERYTFDFDTVLALAAQAYADDEASIVGDCGTDFCPSTDYASQTDRRVREQIYSAFFQLNLNTTFAGFPVDIATGLRFEKTDVTSRAAVPVWNSVDWVGTNEFMLVGSGEQGFTRLTGGYEKLLPSLDINVELRDDLILRASFSETIGRPDYQAIQGGTTVGPLARIEGGNGERGNPGLLPLESINLDLSLEWYYDTASYAAVGIFRKDIRNFLGNSVVEETLFDLPNPGDGPRYRAAVEALGSGADLLDIRNYIIANYPDTVDGGRILGISSGPLADNLMPFNVTVPVNEKDAVVYGVELAVQHAFGDTGFGVIANATIVDGDVSFNDRSMGDQFTVPGMSNSANLVGFYDKDGIQARLAYNWRDKHLVSTFHGTGHANPIYTEAYGQWDLSVSYDINYNLTVFVEGINLTDEYIRQVGRRSEQVMNVIELGPRYNIGVRYTF